MLLLFSRGMMVNKFTEMKSTNNQLSRQATANVAGILATLRKAESFNLAAHGLMDVAHDFHVHGDANENALCEAMLAGIADGLRAAKEIDNRIPRCPNCGRRHR